LAIEGDKVAAGLHRAWGAFVFTETSAPGPAATGVAIWPPWLKNTTTFSRPLYLDGLVDIPWPEARRFYEQRSPLLHAMRFTAVIFLISRAIQDTWVAQASDEEEWAWP